MSKGSEKIIKRQVVLPDGRYLIFYTFAPCDRLDSSHPDLPSTKAKADKTAEEN